MKDTYVWCEQQKLVEKMAAMLDEYLLPKLLPDGSLNDTYREIVLTAAINLVVATGRSLGASQKVLRTGFMNAVNANPDLK